MRALTAPVLHYSGLFYMENLKKAGRPSPPPVNERDPAYVDRVPTFAVTPSRVDAFARTLQVATEPAAGEPGKSDSHPFPVVTVRQQACAPTKPLTVRVALPFVEWIDEWRRVHMDMPSRGDFLREAIEEKLLRDAPKRTLSEG